MADTRNNCVSCSIVVREIRSSTVCEDDVMAARSVVVVNTADASCRLVTPFGAQRPRPHGDSELTGRAARSRVAVSAVACPELGTTLVPVLHPSYEAVWRARLGYEDRADYVAAVRAALPSGGRRDSGDEDSG